MASMARDTRKYKAKKKKKKNREIEACLVDQSITAILAEEKKKRLCVCVCVCVCVSERRKIELTA